MHVGADELQGAAMSVHTDTLPEGHTNTRIQHANYVAERFTPRFYPSPARTNPVDTSRPLWASEQHMASLHRDVSSASSRGTSPPLVRHS